MTLVIIDIDGTIADATRRFKGAGPEPTRDNKEVYDAWVAAVQNADSLLADKPVSGMVAFVSALGSSIGSRAIYLTSREDKWRDVTRKWLLDNRFPKLSLIMRPNEDYREGVDFKEQSIDILRQEFDADNIIVIDDDGKGDIEVMCKRKGWTFLKARSGGGDVHE